GGFAAETFNNGGGFRARHCGKRACEHKGFSGKAVVDNHFLRAHVDAGSFEVVYKCFGLRQSEKFQNRVRHDFAESVNRKKRFSVGSYEGVHRLKPLREQRARFLPDVTNAERINKLT